MTDILVRPSELRASAEQLHASAQRIGQAMQMIDHDISLLRGDKFLGQRATALHSHYAAKREALLKARQLILHFCQDLKTAADVFEKADQQTLPIPPFVTPGIAPTPAEKRFPADWQNIISVSDPDKGITPALIAAVLKYERTHRNLLDGVFDLEAKFILWYEGKLEDSEVAALNLILKLKGESLDSISFGPAQMNPETVRDLVEKGYIAKPDGWDTDQRDVILGMLLNADQAPALVAARLEQIYDHWKDGGVDLSTRPDVLGNLYAYPLDGPQGVHPDLSEDQGERGEAILKIKNRLETEIETI